MLEGKRLGNDINNRDGRMVWEGVNLVLVPLTVMQ